jgi:hypothetical protein
LTDTGVLYTKSKYSDYLSYFRNASEDKTPTNLESIFYSATVGADASAYTAVSWSSLSDEIGCSAVNTNVTIPAGDYVISFFCISSFVPRTGYITQYIEIPNAPGNSFLRNTNLSTDTTFACKYMSCSYSVATTFQIHSRCIAAFTTPLAYYLVNPVLIVKKV